MATIRGIELASDTYGLEDTSARTDIEQNTSAIGTLANLATTVKTNIVAAINEIVEIVTTIISYIPNTASSTNKLVTSDTVAPALEEKFINNLQETIVVPSDVSISYSEFQKSGQTNYITFNSMSVSAAKDANVILCELPSTVPAPKNTTLFELFDVISNKMFSFYCDTSRFIRPTLPLPEGGTFLGSLFYL